MRGRKHYAVVARNVEEFLGRMCAPEFTDDTELCEGMYCFDCPCSLDNRHEAANAWVDHLVIRDMRNEIKKVVDE